MMTTMCERREKDYNDKRKERVKTTMMQERRQKDDDNERQR